MKHLGDITKISGHTAPIVDCIIGGSPCQDLSVAGKRAGLDGERSGLYMEQIRIVKEMRAKDEHNGRTDVDIRPRYMVWENVPGAFSSNKSEDFRIVLEELAKVKDKDAVVPLPADGKWTNYGCIMGDGWSIAWRVLDAQFWGVPQRRRRIALVADFGGQSAHEILFVRKSVSGDTDEGEPKRKEVAVHATGSVGICDRERGEANHYGRSGGDLGVLQGVSGDCVGVDDSIGFDGYNGELTGQIMSTLGVNCDRATGRNGIITFESGIASREGGHIYEGVSGTLRANAGDNQMATEYTLKIRSGCDGGGKGALVQEDLSATLATNNDQYLFQPVYQDKVGSLCVRDYKGVGSQYVEEDKLVVCVDQGGGKSSVDVREDQSPTLTTTHHGAPAVCYGINGDKAGTLDSSYYKGCGMRSGVEREVVAIPVKTRYIVRRLTPLECERLQGYPDGWTDIGEWVDTNGKKRQTSDAARYKALGNSIALPPWKWVLKRLCACYERDATMASLFDGIGGFPYLWEQLNGKGTCLWASEIEEFPIAVTKVRIGE